MNNSKSIVYPNPASSEVTVTHEAMGNGGQLQVQDISGRVLLKRSIIPDSTYSVINITSLQAGEYILIINAGGKNKTFKILKKD